MEDKGMEMEQSQLEAEAAASSPSTASTHTLLGDNYTRSPPGPITPTTMDQEQGLDLSVVTAEERIQELNNLDMEIAKMLAAMGRAVAALAVTEDEPMNLQERREMFQANVKEAFLRLATVDIGQRRSIYALAEAGIIERTPEAQSSKKPVPSMLGNLDIGVLNSQNDKVGKEIEAEQWATVRETLEKLKELGIQSNDSAQVQLGEEGSA